MTFKQMAADYQEIDCILARQIAHLSKQIYVPGGGSDRWARERIDKLRQFRVEFSRMLADLSGEVPRA
jgi:hypothetical protein